jgi:hypothetical protein
MQRVVGKLDELVEDDRVGAGFFQLHAFVEDFLDIGFAAGVAITSSSMVASHSKNVPAHLRGSMGYAGAGKKPGNVGSAPA